MTTSLNAEQIKSILNYAIDNNKKLAEENKMPVAYNISGIAGIGKTSLCKELSGEHDMNFIRVNLAELSYEEITGYPYLAVKLCNNEGECLWVMDKMISLYIAMGWQSLHETRMDYAIPKWINHLDTRPTILYLDDFSRARK